MQILKSDFCHEKQTIANVSERPLAWYTYPALEYLNQLDFSDKTVYEYGCGSSTLFWSERAKKVCSVEHNIEWFKAVQQKLSVNNILHLAENKDDYIDDINQFTDMFDVIIVDGAYRFECAQAAIPRLKCGGMIVLDNSDWCQTTAKLLREAGLIEVDMAGFGPINPYTWTTSFFLHRKFDIPPIQDIQPSPSIGSWKRKSFVGELDIPD
jgi:hypothetical protein